MTSRLRATTARYSSAASAYRRFWAPVLATLVEPLLREVRVGRHATVVDLGAGTGGITTLLARRATRGFVVAVDASTGMLAEAPPALARVCADVERIPLRPRSADVAVSTFMLQHIPRPGALFAEAHSILRDGGILATATWGPVAREEGGPYGVMQRALDRAGAGPDPLARMKTWHDSVDSPEKMERFARRAGFSSVRSWGGVGEYEWTRDAFVGWAGGMSFFARRLATLPEGDRLHVLTRVAREIDRLGARAMSWRPDVVFCLATR